MVARPWLRAPIFGATLAVTLAFTAQAAVADSKPEATPLGKATIEGPVPGGFASWDELFAMQNRMVEATDRIRAVADRIEDSGLGSVIEEPEARKLVFYWRGPVPAEVQGAMKRERIPIEIRPAAHSEKQLRRAVAALAVEPGIVKVGPMPDASGVEVSLAADPMWRTAATRKLDSAGVTTFVTEGGVPRALFSRENDSVPWYAGARVNFPVNQMEAGCTTGFGVYHGGTTKLLSAGHCGYNGQMMWDGNWDFIGYIENDNDARDVQLIGARGGPFMWDGGNLSNFYKPVQGAQRSGVAHWLCTSGSRSGVRCNIKVTKMGHYDGTQGPLVIAEEQSRSNAAGTRDSGGPVFALPSPDNGRVFAKGVISGGDAKTRVDCTGENWSGRVCTWRIYYVDIIDALGTFGASIVTV